MFYKEITRRKEKKNVYNHQSFIFTQIFTLSNALHSFPWIPVIIWCHFPSAWRTETLVFIVTHLLSKNFVSFCLSESVFISPYFWRIVLLNIEFLFDTFFFHHLGFIFPLCSSFHCFWGSAAINCIVIALYLVNHFLLPLWKFSLYFWLSAVWQWCIHT